MEDKRALIVHSNPKSHISEAYRVLRTNIQFAGVNKPLKMIVVTSSGQGEGKTTTIANLAITFAQSGCKTLLIDADLRRPKIHRTFGLLNRFGLTTILAMQDKSNYQEYVHGVDIENLYVLTSGPTPPNPSELLASNSMKAFLERIREEYDIILIDSPPIGTVTDPAILSTSVDGTILVAASSRVEIEALQRAKGLLERVNANIIGVVLNKIGVRGKRNYYYLYYYGGEEEEEKEKHFNIFKKRKIKKRKIKKRIKY